MIFFMYFKMLMYVFLYAVYEAFTLYIQLLYDINSSGSTPRLLNIREIRSWVSSVDRVNEHMCGLAPL